MIYKIVYAIIGVLLLWLVIKLFSKPIKWVFKLLLNTLLGFVLLLLFNYVGQFIGLSINIGWLSALITGVLGVPGIVLLLLVENFIL